MVKNPKLLILLCCGAIIALLVYSQASRSTRLVTHDGSGVSDDSATSLVREEKLSVKLSPSDPNITTVSLNGSQATFQMSSGATSPLSIKGATGPPGDPADWNLTFSDEFDGKSLDRDKWATEYGFDTDCIVDNPPSPGIPTYCNRSNNDEKEWYIDESPSVKDGVLRLVASTNDCSGDGLPDRNYEPYTCANFPYLSGMVSTYDRFSQMYGYFEARIKLVNGQGFWPAFWLIPQLPRIPNSDIEFFWPPEIDIMENKGQEPNLIYMAHHYSGVYPIPGSKLNNWSYGGLESNTYRGPDYTADFHTYAVEWQPGLIIWYIDGNEQFRSTFNTPPGAINPPEYLGEMMIIINLAVGGGFVGNLLPPEDLLPAIMEVDYVHVYQYSTLPTAEFSSNSPLVLGETAIFNNNSFGTEPLSFAWDFGDTFTSILRNPTHAYTAAGTYTVTLTAINNNGSDTITHEIDVWLANNTIYLPCFTKN